MRARGDTGASGTARSFPALGFDPADGDRGALSDVLISLGEAGIQLGEVTGRMVEALDVSNDWDGDAADDFHDYGDDLPKSFGSGAESIEKVAGALTAWSGQLIANQAKADELERKAKELKEKLKTASGSVDLTARAYGSAGESAKPAAYNTYLDAVNRWSDLNTALEKVIADAQRLKAKHLREANAAASAIRGGPDDAFEPENDNWFVQFTDGVAKASGIVSTASAAIAAGSLLIPGVGEVVAPVAGTISAGANGINLAAGLVQKANGSRNAPGWFDLALNAVPAKTLTSGAIGFGKGALRPAIGSGRPRTGASGLKQGAKDGFSSAGYPALAGEIRDFQRTAARIGFQQALRSKAATTSVVLAHTERTELAGKVLANSVDATVKTLEASGVRLTPAQRKEVEVLKVLANPGREQLENSTIKVTTDTIKGK